MCNKPSSAEPAAFHRSSDCWRSSYSAQSVRDLGIYLEANVFAVFHYLTSTASSPPTIPDHHTADFSSRCGAFPTGLYDIGVLVGIPAYLVTPTTIGIECRSATHFYLKRNLPTISLTH